MSKIIDSFRLRDIINFRVLYKAPLSYKSPGETINVCGTLTLKYDEEIHRNYKSAIGKELKDYLPKSSDQNIIVYLQGGPGFPCNSPTDKDAINTELIDKGYQIFYLDQRGTGYSTPIESQTILSLNDVDAQLEYIINFRADSIVADAELIRKDLLGDGKWSLIGQSYGGFCIFTYLSKYPDSVKEAIITGGVPPVNFTVDDVYTATYERTRERNVHYYKKYPHDADKVLKIAKYLDENVVTLPNGGNLSVERFQTLGLNFGGTGGTDAIHQIVLKFDYELEYFGKPTYQTLNQIQLQYSFDTNIIYALFQEAIYCDGNSPSFESSNWSADRLRYMTKNGNYVYSKETHKLGSEYPLYFTGEMVYKSMFEDYSELRKLKKLAYALHNYKEWSKLYDVEVLENITWEKVPVVASTYVYDQYVDFDLTRRVKKEVFKDNGNLRQYITSDYFHNGLRADPKKVLGALFDLLIEEVD